jgi:hypothetical protein
MATPNPAAKADEMNVQADLEDELRQAEEDFARGDFVEVTVAELDRCVAAGEWPWPNESSDSARRSVGA